MLIRIIALGLLVIYCVWAYRLREGLHFDVRDHPGGDDKLADFTPLSQVNFMQMSYEGNPVYGQHSYPVSFLAPNVAQYGRRVRVIHPSLRTREDLFPSNYAEMHMSSSSLAANPEPAPQLETDGGPAMSGSSACPTCKTSFKPDYECRPSLSGMFRDCGPYGLNVGRYGDQLTGCNCPLQKNTN